MSGSDPLWRQCAVWLDKLRLIPARHPSLKPNSRPQDLLNLLRYRLKTDSRPQDLPNLLRYNLKTDSRHKDQLKKLLAIKKVYSNLLKKKQQ